MRPSPTRRNHCRGPRPKLASLGPVDEITLKPDGDDALRRRTAIYDITAKTVYLPNGERLEAHSGLGEMMDDPRYKHLRMRSVTPPNTYNLTLRESLFHGVQAIRLNPVDEKAMFGRAGILAHSYPARAERPVKRLHLVPRLPAVFECVSARRDRPDRRGRPSRQAAGAFVDRSKVRGAATAL